MCMCGVARKGVITTNQVKFSTNASYTIAEIVEAVPKDATLFFQLYVNTNRAVSEKQLVDAERLGIKGVFVTIDAPIPGKREADERVRADEEFKSPITNSTAKNDKRGGGIAR
jgi:L-lactate dehydrogenase (cytochrome)